MTSRECFENKWFYTKYIGKYLSGEILLARECMCNVFNSNRKASCFLFHFIFSWYVIGEDIPKSSQMTLTFISCYVVLLADLYSKKLPIFISLHHSSTSTSPKCKGYFVYHRIHFEKMTFTGDQLHRFEKDKTNSDIRKQGYICLGGTGFQISKQVNIQSTKVHSSRSPSLYIFDFD